jgi:hypothetical protein
MLWMVMVHHRATSRRWAERPYGMKDVWPALLVDSGAATPRIIQLTKWHRRRACHFNGKPRRRQHCTTVGRMPSTELTCHESPPAACSLEIFLVGMYDTLTLPVKNSPRLSSECDTSC